MSVHRSVLGAAYDSLPQAVRTLHDRGGMFEGGAEVDGDPHLLARAVRALANLPPPGRTCALTFELKTGAVEQWTRRFGEDVMRSTITAIDGRLVERLGIATLAFTLHVEDDGVRWDLQSARVLGIPLPKRLFRGVRAREFVAGERYHFAVEARLPLVGTVVRYRGTLDVD